MAPNGIDLQIEECESVVVRAPSGSGKRILLMANCPIMEAFETGVQPLLKKARVEMGRHPDPIVAFRESHYFDRIAAQRVGPGLGALAG